MEGSVVIEEVSIMPPKKMVGIRHICYVFSVKRFMCNPPNDLSVCQVCR